jgi:CubicO group peptidase (beta-lactamase class C family)
MGKRGVICLLLLSLSLQCVASQNDSSRIDFDALDTTLSSAVDNEITAGTALLLSQDNEVIYKQAFGTLNTDAQVQITSSSKAVAAVSVLRLVDDGVLSLDDTIGHWLPEFRGTPVEHGTLRQLLSHTAGIIGHYPGGFPTEGTLADFSELIASRGRLNPPGTFSYGGVGFDIACRIAEVASAMTYEEHLDSRVWFPLGMTQTRYSVAADPDSVTGIELARGEGRYVSCGGGIESTLEDVAVFFEMLEQGGSHRGTRYLSEASFDEMTRKQSFNSRLADDPYTTGEYGLGVFRDRVAADGSPLTISHGGSFGTMPWIDFDSGLVAVFFADSRLVDVRPLIADVQAGVRSTTDETPAFSINAGLNDAWFNPDTPGQGFFIMVWEDVQTVFLGWFNYDVERPPENIAAILGEPGHRWFTAQGSYTGVSAELDVYLTRGGVFDSAEPEVLPSEKQGTMQLNFTGCNAATISYDIPAFNLSGTIPIERIAPDNIALCQ